MIGVALAKSMHDSNFTFISDVIMIKCIVRIELDTSPHKFLATIWNACLVLDLKLQHFYRVGRFHFEEHGGSVQ